MIEVISEKSDKLWMSVFNECDLDKDGDLTSRELLVLIKRLGLDIPSEEELDELLTEYDDDENGLISFDELCKLAYNLGVDRTADSLEGEQTSFRRALGAYLKERRSIVLWRTIFDEIDKFPSDGLIDASELALAFGVLDGPDLDQEKLRRLMRKYDKDGNDKLDYEEFCAMATDTISSAVQYERAQRNRGDQSSALEQCEQRAEVGNAHRLPCMVPSSGKLGELSSEERMWLSEVDKRLHEHLGESGTLDTPSAVLGVQDDLFLKYRIKYAPNIDDNLNGQRVMLLDAIKGGDLDKVRSLMTIDWDFVYPPAYLDDDGTRHLEAWCRSPLTLLVRPDEGSLTNKLRDVSATDRIALLQDVLSSGCADPNFPPLYWSTPAMHASFEGDVDALEILRISGCDLRQTVEWGLQDEPLFDLVHAAAFNGQEHVLRYLREHFPPSFFQNVDAEGNNALHTLLSSSRDMGTARFLLEQDVDGFAFNYNKRSPLSMAIETLPELAQLLLEKKSRFEYSWWGMDVYWFSFDGVILPLEPRTDGDSCGFPHGACGPVQVRDRKGELTTVEDLIIANECKSLLETPIMLDLIDRKWRFFASEAYRNRAIKFTLMLVAVFVSSIKEGSAFTLATSGVAAFAVGAWALNLQAELARGKSLQERVSKLSVLDALDYFHLLAVPLLQVLFFAEAAGFGVQAAGLPGEPLAIGFLQVTLSLRLLSYISISRALGPLLVTVLSMLYDVVKFSGLLVIVFLGYANGLYALIHEGNSEEALAALKFDYSYSGIVTEMGLWLAGNAGLDIVEGLSEQSQVGVQLLFWTFIAAAYFVLLNLLIAIFNSTYERILSNSISEWLFIKLAQMLEFESDYTQPSVQTYYEGLRSQNAQRNVLLEKPSA